MNLSKLNRITHRDIGYLIAGLTIIYALSGIALNHKHDWNPNYLVDAYEFTTDINFTRESFNDDIAVAILKNIPGNPEYKTFHYPSGNRRQATGYRLQASGFTICITCCLTPVTCRHFSLIPFLLRSALCPVS